MVGSFAFYEKPGASDISSVAVTCESKGIGVVACVLNYIVKLANQLDKK